MATVKAPQSGHGVSTLRNVLLRKTGNPRAKSAPSCMVRVPMSSARLRRTKSSPLRILQVCNGTPQLEGSLSRWRTAHAGRTQGTCMQAAATSEVLGWFFIGNADTAADIMLLEALTIGFILNCTEQVPFASSTTCNCRIGLCDACDQALQPWLSQAISFLVKAQESGQGCLVHCSAGISRSSAVVLAYLVVRERFSLGHAWRLLKERHRAARPNIGFITQLLQLDREVHGTASADFGDFGFVIKQQVHPCESSWMGAWTRQGSPRRMPSRQGTPCAISRFASTDHGNGTTSAGLAKNAGVDDWRARRRQASRTSHQ